MLVGWIVYWRSGSDATAVRTGEKKDPDLAELMAPGPLEDISLGKDDAPNTIVEYASMTCPHCAAVPQGGAARSWRRNISIPAKRG